MTSPCCPIGAREDLADVDAALRQVGEDGAESLSGMARRLEIPRTSLWRHRSVCLGLGAVVVPAAAIPPHSAAVPSDDDDPSNTVPSDDDGTIAEGAEEQARTHSAVEAPPVARARGLHDGGDPHPPAAGAPGSAASGPAAGPSPALPRARLQELADLLARLPLRQQDVVLRSLPLALLQREAVLRGLVGHPLAAEAIAVELRALEV
jgi:hypothetical protein